MGKLDYLNLGGLYKPKSPILVIKDGEGKTRYILASKENRLMANAVGQLDALQNLTNYDVKNAVLHLKRDVANQQRRELSRLVDVLEQIKFKKMVGEENGNR